MKKKADTFDEKGNEDVILDLNFVPQWARKPPGANHYSDYRKTDHRRGDDHRKGDRRSPRREERTRRPPRSSERSHDRSSRSASDSRRPPRRAPIHQDIPVTVSFLPEQKRLASLVRQIHHSRRAYPLMDLANLFIQDTNGYLVKIEANRDASDFHLFQCARCKAVSSSSEQIENHLLSKHLEDLFEKEELEIDPPSGKFVCVARCRKSGVLLGPPNHHSYAEKLNELHQSRFPHLSLEEYKRQIETVHDEEAIEQWREQNRKITRYRLKSDPSADPIDRSKAEALFRQMIPEMYEKTRRAVLPSKVAQTLEDRNVTHAIRDAWSKESRFPLSMSFSMRAAFRHMHLHVFKAGRINFVTHIKPRPIRPEDTVENIAEVLRYLEAHPGSTRLELLEVIHPSIDPKSKEAVEALQPLAWLIERGHIIEFFNGTLSVPLGRRR